MYAGKDGTKEQHDVSEENQRLISQSEATTAISTVIGFMALAFFLYAAVAKFSSSAQSDISLLFDTSGNVVAPDVLIMAFLVIHHLRLWMGVNFVMADESFGAAITSTYRANLKKVQKNELRLRLALVISVVFFLVILNGSYGIWFLVAAMIFQSVILILYNYIFFEAMYSKDKQRAANVFIAVGDIIIILFSLLLFAYATFDHINPNVDVYAATISAIGVGGLGAIFLGECIAQYFPALWKIVKTLNRGIV